MAKRRTRAVEKVRQKTTEEDCRQEGSIALLKKNRVDGIVKEEGGTSESGPLRVAGSGRWGGRIEEPAASHSGGGVVAERYEQQWARRHRQKMWESRF
jgi:hypothetical protein